MKDNISLAGFVLTADEWETLDPFSQAELMTDEDELDAGWEIPAKRERRADVVGVPAWEAAEDPWAFADEPWSSDHARGDRPR